MATETENTFDKATQAPADSDLFAGDIRPDVTARDLFAGDENLIKVLESSARPNLLSQAAITASRTGRWFTPTHIILTLNILVISGVLIYFLVRPAPAPVTIIQQAPELPKAPTQRLPGTDPARRRGPGPGTGGILETRRSTVPIRQV